MSDCKGGAETGVDLFTGQVLHENDDDFHDWDPSTYEHEETTR